jgi:excisionase family DNA binding protein
MEQLALTIPEACHAARIGRTRLYEAIKNGELIAAKCGRKTIIRLDDLKTWLAHLPNVSSAGEAAVATRNPSTRAAPSQCSTSDRGFDR